MSTPSRARKPAHSTWYSVKVSNATHNWNNISVISNNITIILLWNTISSFFLGQPAFLSHWISTRKTCLNTDSYGESFCKQRSSPAFQSNTLSCTFLQGLGCQGAASKMSPAGRRWDRRDGERKTPAASPSSTVSNSEKCREDSHKGTSAPLLAQDLDQAPKPAVGGSQVEESKRSGQGIQTRTMWKVSSFGANKSWTTGKLKYDTSKGFFYLIDWHIFYSNKGYIFTKTEACAF